MVRFSFGLGKTELGRRIRVNHSLGKLMTSILCSFIGFVFIQTHEGFSEQGWVKFQQKQKKYGPST